MIFRVWKASPPGLSGCLGEPPLRANDNLLSIINSNYVVILNSPVKTVRNETSYMTSYLWIIVPYLAPFSRHRPKQCYCESQTKNKKQIGPSSRHLFTWTENDLHMAPPETFSLHQVWTKSRWCCPSYGSKCVYIQDGRQAAIMGDIKNLFDVLNPWT